MDQVLWILNKLKHQLNPRAVRRRSLTIEQRKHVLLMESFAILLVSEACHDVAAAALIEPPAAGDGPSCIRRIAL